MEQEKIMEAEVPTVRWDSPGGRHPNRTNGAPTPQPQGFLQAGCPSCHPTNSVIALKACSPYETNRNEYYSMDSYRDIKQGCICHVLSVRLLMIIQSEDLEMLVEGCYCTVHSVMIVYSMILDTDCGMVVVVDSCAKQISSRQSAGL